MEIAGERPAIATKSAEDMSITLPVTDILPVVPTYVVPPTRVQAILVTPIVIESFRAPLTDGRSWLGDVLARGALRERRCDHRSFEQILGDDLQFLKAEVVLYEVRVDRIGAIFGMIENPQAQVDIALNAKELIF